MTHIVIIENALIIVAEGFWLLSNSSQLRRLIKTRNTKGLSAPNQTLNAAADVAWATYFASRQLWVPVFTSLTMGLISVATLAYTLGNRKQFIRGLIAIAIIAPLSSFLLITFPSVAGWLGVVFNTIASTPWLIHIVTTKKTSGISERSLFFALGASLCTLTYALLIVALPLVVACVISITFNLIILAYYYRYRHA